MDYRIAVIVALAAGSVVPAASNRPAVYAKAFAE